jgi:hypothetical protein
MSKLMFKENGGFHSFSDVDVAKATADGWVDGEPVRKALMDAKMGIAKPVETVTIQAVVPQDTPPRRPGRPPKIAEEI